MSWKNWPRWLRLGIIFATISIILSIIAYSLPGIRNPEGYSDFESLFFPNVLLGFPIFLILDFFNLYFGNYKINLFIELFVFLTLYWFLVGIIISFIYSKIKNKRKAAANL